MYVPSLVPHETDILCASFVTENSIAETWWKTGQTKKVVEREFDRPSVDSLVLGLITISKYVFMNYLWR